MVFICISLVARDPQHSFMYLLGIQIPFLEEILLMFFAHFLTGLCVLLLLSFMRSLHMLNTDPLPVAWLAKVFFHVLVAPSFCGGSLSQCRSVLVLAISSKIVWHFAWPIHITFLFIHFGYRFLEYLLYSPKWNRPKRNKQWIVENHSLSTQSWPISVLFQQEVWPFSLPS